MPWPLLGGNFACWSLYYSYATCCDPALWGPTGNEACWGGQLNHEYCCGSSAGVAEPCGEHLLQLDDESAYLISRVLEVVRCRWWRAGAAELPETLNYLALAAKRAAQMADPYRTLSLIGLEWQRLTGEGAHLAMLRTLRAAQGLGERLPALPAAALQRAKQLLRHSARWKGSSSIGGQLGCCDPLAYGGLGSLDCLVNASTTRGGVFGPACGSSPEGEGLRRCAEEGLAGRHQAYPRIRGHWSPWGFDGSNRIGRLIWCLCFRPDVDVVLDLFAHTGSGGALMVAHALASKGSGRGFTVEREPRWCEASKVNLEGYSSLDLVCGDAVDEVPKICGVHAVDFVIYDQPPFPPGLEGSLVRDRLLQVVAACRPRWWIFYNIQQDDLYLGLLENLLRDGQHELALHDFSPNLVADGRLGWLQEFVVVRRLPQAARESD